MAPGELGQSVPQNSPKLDCRGQGESCRHQDKPVQVEGVLGNYPEAQSTCEQRSGWGRPGSQSCGNNGCFLMQEAERWTISIQPQISKLSFQQACRGRRSSCACCGLCRTHRASVYLPVLFGTLTSLGMSPRGGDSGRALAGLSEPNRTTLLLQGWTVGSAHASGGTPAPQARLGFSALTGV